MSFSLKIIKRGDKFRQMEQRAKPEAVKIVSTAAMVTASVARQLAPVDTGAMRDSIYVEQQGEARFTVGVKESYAKFVEYGTVHQDAQPFLRPAFELARKDFEAALRKFFASVSA
jgi:HK97 gp10 family phage protein